MAKAMAAFGMLVGALLTLAFGADIVIGAPFGGESFMMDILFTLAALMLTYISWDAFRSAG